MSTKSTRGLDYNGKLFEYVIIYEFRCTDPKCLIVNLAILETKKIKVMPTDGA